MLELKDEELMNVDGGAGITATFLNSVSRAISTLMEVGRTLGSALRRTISGKTCSF